MVCGKAPYPAEMPTLPYPAAPPVPGSPAVGVVITVPGAAACRRSGWWWTRQPRWPSALRPRSQRWSRRPPRTRHQRQPRRRPARTAPDPERGRELLIPQPLAQPVPDLHRQRPRALSRVCGRDLRIRFRPGNRLHAHDIPDPAAGTRGKNDRRPDHDRDDDPDQASRSACRELTTGIIYRGSGDRADLWADITSFVQVVAGGQWLYLRVLLSNKITVPPAVVSVPGLLALLILYAIWTVTPPDLPVFQPG